MKSSLHWIKAYGGKRQKIIWFWPAIRRVGYFTIAIGRSLGL